MHILRTARSNRARAQLFGLMMLMIVGALPGSLLCADGARRVAASELYT